ncbi:Ppx/GppA phosphatase family protein [Streptococcus caprae]|uniref:Exopolyphosphatase n=1 Tax=Streptococcus caprae TaxID=1640501 RepID=A0ABV8CX54_9STRE
MNYGIVDIGSNTIRLNIYQVQRGRYSVLFTKKYTIGLAAYVEDSQLSPEGLAILLETLTEIKSIQTIVTMQALHVFATASLRNVTNQDDILEAVQDQLGISIDLLSQNNEADLTHLGIREVFGLEDGLSIDIGGGSTEIALFENGRAIQDVYLDKGSLNLYKQAISDILPTVQEVISIHKTVTELILDQDPTGTYPTITGTGGAIRAVGKVIKKLYRTGDATHFTRQQAEKLLTGLLVKDKKTLTTVLKVTPERIHTLTPGLIILLETMRTFNSQEVILVSTGIREGYLKKLLMDKQEWA